jgi:COMPASS component SWD1
MEENWSAFAPDFKELEDNVEYEEREDEFDHMIENEGAEKPHEEDEDVDILTDDMLNYGKNTLHYIPLLELQEIN